MTPDQPRQFPERGHVAAACRSAGLRFGLFTLVALLAAGCASTASYARRREAAERSGICYVHHERMKRERLAIVYGLIVFPRELSQAGAAQFPFARRDLLGGCLIITDVDHPERSSPQFGEGYVCPACTAAKARWSHDHPDPRAGSTGKTPDRVRESASGLVPGRGPAHSSQ